MRFRERKRKELHIDVINMVDVFLNLLIFFMLSTTFIVSPGIKVTLPKSAVDVIPKEDQDLRIWLPKSGDMYLNSDSVNREELQAALTKTYRQNASALIIIQADENVSHGKVVEIMDMVRQTGLTRVAIATQPKEEKSPPSTPEGK